MSKTQAQMNWPVAAPFVQARTATKDDVDGFGHVNNVRYIDWAMDVAWAHSSVLGFAMEDYNRIGVGCVVWRHEFDYAAPVLAGEDVLIATWIAENDGRVRMVRAFEMRSPKSQKVIFKGRTLFVTIDMKTGKPTRMPEEFIEAYKPAL